jgi:hypothetical protein
MKYFTTMAVFLLALTLFSAPVWAQQDPAGNRSMAFEPGLGAAARERVPGGRLVILAYSAAVGLIGGYVMFVARKAAKIDDDVRRLEDDLARRGPASEKE